MTWTATSETLPSTYPVYWDGTYYWTALRRSADGITWTAPPTLPANATAVLMARDSDGAVAISTSDKKIFVSTDHGASWTLKRTSTWDIVHGFSATNGTRVWWTEDSTRGLYTDALFEDANNTYGTNGQEYTPYYGGGFVITKSFNGRIIRTPENSAVGAEVAIINYAGREQQNIAYDGATWACENLVLAASPAQHSIYTSTDGGENWAQITGTLYGDGGNLVYVGPTV